MTDSGVSLLQRAAQHQDRLAIVARDGQCTYAQLLQRSAHAAATFLNGHKDLAGARVAFLAPADLSYVITQWAIWQAGGVAVPLCTLHPRPELEHVIADADAEIVVSHPDYEGLVSPLAAAKGARHVSTRELLASSTHQSLPTVAAERDAMLIYTSGTTGKPKGVLTTHAIIAAQLHSVTSAWEYTARDRSLLVLPLHHLHGVLNVLLGTLWAGGVCEMHAGFDANAVWRRIMAQNGLTMFMAVPTIYSKLIAAYDAAPEADQAAMRAGCRALRLMVSGSAALPLPILERFQEISGHTLLERYGMTEIGMALGNPLHGVRLPGHVGQPFPGIEVRVVDAEENPLPEGHSGQLQVRGPSVFKGYFRRAEDTAASFTRDGFFRTGDEGVVEHGAYRILGRMSVDILKTGGYKVSALEIEAALRNHPAIVDCAVVGIDDPQWGQRVAAAVILKPKHTLSLDELRTFGKQLLAAYKVPTQLLIVDDFPRNALGKVQKKQVAALFDEKLS